MSGPRAIAVFDVGATNTKLVLFDPDGQIVAVEKMASVHLPAPPYLAIDPEPIFDFAAETLPKLDAILPVDVIVPSAHGSALALLRDDGSLALPVMDYQAEPPQHVVDGYAAIAPRFSEVFAPVIPASLTLGRQLYWQQTEFSEAFREVETIQPWGQYIGFRLGGRKVTEVTALGAQTQLWDVQNRHFSSLADLQGWSRLFAPPASAWEPIGKLARNFRGTAFRGRGEIRAGVHDSSANYFRYLAAGRDGFTLLSTGTWIIGFDTEADIRNLDPVRDTVSNTNIFGKPVASCRFFGGKEFEILSAGAPADAASLETAGDLIETGIFALPSFTDTGGPMPGTGGRGRIEGGTVASPAERATLASIYCALMSSESLDAIGSHADIIIDGPFSANPVFLGILSALRPGQSVLASGLSDGTTAGAALIGTMTDEAIPAANVELCEVAPADIQGLADYQVKWRELSA